MTAAQHKFQEIMTMAAPDPSGAFMETGTLGFVFGELWQRGVLSVKERRWIAITCAGVTGSATPIESHVWAALNSGDISYSEYDEFVLHFATQLGWPKASVLHVQGILAAFRLADERKEPLEPHDYERLREFGSEAARANHGRQTYREIWGAEAPQESTPFAATGTLGFLYGEIWSRERYLTQRERRIISICCASSAHATRQTSEHVVAALATGELTLAELREVALHVGAYLGWIYGRELDELVTAAAQVPSSQTPEGSVQ